MAGKKKTMLHQVIRTQIKSQLKVTIPMQRTFVSGQLRDYIQHWRRITTDPVVLNAVQGLTIPLTKRPPVRQATKEELTRKDSDEVVDQSIKEMLDLQAIKEIPPDSRVFISHVFTVPQVERGIEYARRFILNLKVGSY